MPKDIEEGVSWVLKAAHQGVVGAQRNMGYYYKDGFGVQQSFPKAAKWWRQAAEQGDGDAQIQLGLAHIIGKGVIENYILAHMWLNLGTSNEGASTSKVKGAEEARTNIERLMLPSDIRKSQEKARQCLNSNYKKCD